MSLMNSAPERSTLGLHSLEHYEPLVGAVATGRMLRKIERVRTMHVAHVSSTFYRSGDWHLVQGTPGETVWKGAAVGCANGSVHVPRESVRKGF